MPKINKRSYRWKVDPEATGAMRCFYRRAWPSLEEVGGEEYLAGFIRCNEAYTPRNSKRTDLSLRVVLFDWRDPVNRRTLVSKVDFTNLPDAKAYLEKLVALYPAFAPERPKSLLTR